MTQAICIATYCLWPNGQGVGEIMDSIILEQFLQSLPKNTWVWMRRRQSATLKDLIKLHKEFIEVAFLRNETCLLRGQEPGKKGRDLLVVKPAENKWGEVRGSSSMG